MTLGELEVWLGQHAHVVSAVEAVSTFLAVIVSLSLWWFTKRETKAKVTAEFSIGIGESGTHVGITIINKGHRVVRFSGLFFEWRVPFMRRQSVVLLANKINSEVIQRKDSGILVESGQMCSVYLWELTEFNDVILVEMSRIKSEMRWFRNWRIRGLGARLRSEERDEFKVKFARTIHDTIKTAVRTLPKD